MNQIAKNNLKIMEEIAAKPEYQAGYPNWYGISKLKLPKIPGAQPGVTWCIFVAWEVGEKLGFDTSSLLNTKGIGFTNGNDMYKNIWKSVLDGKLKTIPEGVAQKMANGGDLILLSSFNINKGAGHVAIVSPCDKFYSVDRGCRIIQGGSKNGSFWRKEIFNINCLTPPIFVRLNRKGK